MGKDEILDARDKIMTKNKPSGICLFSLIILLFSTACGMPRIIVLNDPLTPEEHLNLGVSYEKNNELDAAVSEYKAAAKSLPIAYLYLGNVSFGKGEYADAEDCYRKAIKKDPANAEAYNNLAWLYYTQGRNFEEAEGLALRAVELNPAKADVYCDTLEKIRDMKKSR
jgi:tetratricopeptide (TPR) repeat protein